VELSERTIERLRRHAVPLEDTFDTTIARLIKFYEAYQLFAPETFGAPIGSRDYALRFDPKAPPSLRYTTMTMALLNDDLLNQQDTYWNKVMNKVVVELAKQGNSPEAICALLKIKSEVGKRSDGGYTYLPEAGVSLQGQDSDAAFKQIVKLVTAHKVKLLIWFYWQDNEKAAYPRKKGHFEILSGR
jgi:hypothetical protein